MNIIVVLLIIALLYFKLHIIIVIYIKLVFEFILSFFSSNPNNIDKSYIRNHTFRCFTPASISEFSTNIFLSPVVNTSLSCKLIIALF